MMRDMTAQMQKAKPRAGMTPEQMREWMDEHLKLMDQPDGPDDGRASHDDAGHGQRRDDGRRDG